MMKATLVAGLSTTRTFAVDRERTIDFMGENARVYATPMLVRDVEIAVICAALVDQGDRDAAQQVLSDFLERKAASSRASVATHLRHAIAMYSLE